MEVLIQAEVTCLAEFLLSLSEVDFEGDPRFVWSDEAIPKLDVVSKLARPVDDVVRKVDDLFWAEGGLSCVC